MPTAEETLRQTAEETKRKSIAALEQGQNAGKDAALAAQTNIKAQQTDALNRLLADARTRGYTGTGDTLQAEMTGPADRRVQSIEQGLGGRNQDYENRKASLGDLYGRMEALAPMLASQIEASRAAGGGRGGGGGGGGGGSGGGAGPWSTQSDVLTEILDRVTQDDTQQETMDYERLLANLEGIGWKGADTGQALLRANDYNIAKTGGALAGMSDEDFATAYGSSYVPSGGRGWTPTLKAGSFAVKQAQARAALQRALDDAMFNKTRVQTKTQARTQSTNKDKVNSRERHKTVQPIIPRMVRGAG